MLRLSDVPSFGGDVLRPSVVVCDVVDVSSVRPISSITVAFLVLVIKLPLSIEDVGTVVVVNSSA